MGKTDTIAEGGANNASLVIRLINAATKYDGKCEDFRNKSERARNRGRYLSDNMFPSNRA